MFVQDRDDARRYFVRVRQKYNDKQALDPLEQLILDVILAHPEYHGILDQGGELLRHDYSPEAGNINPFLHMSMHIAIKEQIETDRPAGIRDPAFGHATIAVDTHIFRVSNRTGIAPGKDVLEVELRLLKFVPDDFKQDAHHWLILHGRYRSEKIYQDYRPV